MTEQPTNYRVERIGAHIYVLGEIIGGIPAIEMEPETALHLGRALYNVALHGLDSLDEVEDCANGLI